MNAKKNQEIKDQLTHFAKEEGLLCLEDKGLLFIDHKQIDHGYGGGVYFADCDAIFEVSGEDAKHVAAIFITHMIHRPNDGFDIQLEPDWYRDEKRRNAR